jgi:hypothetical protein
MAMPLIAIVGSADPTRTAELELTHVDRAGMASEQLGRELAAAGCRIVVYSGDPTFIEAHVVRGYVGSGKAVEGSIEVRFPDGSQAAEFPEYQTHRAAFRFQPDTSKDWEVSFYRSLVGVDGVLLLGGGRSSLISGLVALGNGLPVAAVATFGGNARKVWTLIDPDSQLLEEGAHAAMAPPIWDDAAAGRLVQVLVGQHRRRLELAAARRRAETAGARRRTRDALLVMALFVAAMVGVTLGLRGLEPGSWPLYAVVLLTPLLAGAAGATAKTVFEPDPERGATVVAALGLAAGGISELLFLLSQLATSPELLSATAPDSTTRARNLALVGAGIGFIAGLTFESVYRKLSSVDVVRTETLGAVLSREDSR